VLNILMTVPAKIVNTVSEMCKDSAYPVSLKDILIVLLDVLPKELIPEMEIN